MAFDPLSFIIGQQTAKGSGGGSGDYSDVHFVTFMSEDGTTELYKRPVADGDDCADPVIRGLISEPTKESTAQYNYTHVGWSASANGALDENILKAITADKTVYANFAAVLRYYTITYYDEDGTTVLKTESLAYGTMPNYVAEKEGFGFKGWTPELATVTGNASYIAVWTEFTFGNASWAQIAEISEAGEAEQYFALGDSKTLVMTKTDGTIIEVPVIIADFNHDDLADGSGKAGITVVCNKIVNAFKVGSIPNDTIYGDFEVRTHLNSGSVYQTLPSELTNVIKEVSKISANGMRPSNTSQTGLLKTTTEKVWLLSLAEVGLTDYNATAGDGTQYPIFTDDASRIRKSYINNKALEWPLRTGYKAYPGTVASVSANGTADHYTLSASNNAPLVFGFCI